MIYIGIDPGKSGAMAIYELIGNEPQEIQIFQFDEKVYAEKLREISDCPCMCCIERVGSRPKQGVSSTFSFGENYGFIQGILTAFEIPYQLIPPRTWKAEFGLNSDKEKSVSVCKRLFPNVFLRRTERRRKDDDGMAEALLMAEYARRRL